MASHTLTSVPSKVGQRRSRLPVRTVGQPKPTTPSVPSRARATYAAFKEGFRSRLPRPVTAVAHVKPKSLPVPSYMKATKASEVRAATRSSTAKSLRPLVSSSVSSSSVPRSRAPVKKPAPMERPSAVPRIVDPYERTTVPSSSSANSKSAAADKSLASSQATKTLPTLWEALWLWDCHNPLPSAKDFDIEAWTVHRMVWVSEREKFANETQERINSAEAAQDLTRKFSSHCRRRASMMLMYRTALSVSSSSKNESSAGTSQPISDNCPWVPATQFSVESGPTSGSSQPISDILRQFPCPPAALNLDSSEDQFSIDFSSAIGDSFEHANQMSLDLPERPSNPMANDRERPQGTFDESLTTPSCSLNMPEASSSSDPLVHYEDTMPEVDPVDQLADDILALTVTSPPESNSMSFDMDDILTGRAFVTPRRQRISKVPRYEEVCVPRVRPFQVRVPVPFDTVLRPRTRPHFH